MSGPVKVIFIGLDGAEPELILRWSDEGVLPTFRSLRENGIWALTHNPPRIYNGAVWPSLNTGVIPARHGRYFYTKLEGYHVRGLRPTEVTHRPFWDFLTHEGKRVALIDVPYAAPADDLNGIQVVDWLVHDRSLVPEDQRISEIDGTVAEYSDFSTPKIYTHPEFLASEVLKFGINREVPACELSGRSKSAFKSFRTRLIERIKAKADFSIRSLEKGPWDLFMTVFHEAHDVGHECWHIHDPDHPDHDPEYASEIGDPVKDVYVAIDKAIGRVLEHAGPEATAIVYSSHGMGPVLDGNSMLDLVLSHLEEGPTPKGLTMVEVLNRTWGAIPPSLRTALSPLRNRVRKKVHEALVEPTRERRKCFAIPTNAFCGGVRVNLVGREPHGRIHPGKEYDDFCEVLKEDLLEIVDADTSERAVRAVVRYEDMFPRDVYTENIHTGEYPGDRADFLVDWTKRSFRALKSPKIGTIENTNQSSRTGDHKDVGLFVAFSQHMQPGRLPNRVRVIDIAPTIASILEVPLPDVDGAPLSALVDT